MLSGLTVALSLLVLSMLWLFAEAHEMAGGRWRRVCFHLACLWHDTGGHPHRPSPLAHPDEVGPGYV